MKRFDFLPDRSEASDVMSWYEYCWLINLDANVSPAALKKWQRTLFSIDAIKANGKGEIALIQIIGRQYYFPE